VHGHKRAADQRRGAEERSCQEPDPVQPADCSPQNRSHFSALTRLHPSVPPFRPEPAEQCGRVARGSFTPAPSENRTRSSRLIRLLHPGSRATDQSPVSTASIRFRHVPTVHSRSSSQHAPDGSRPAFSRNAHHPSRCAGAASGGLDPDPAVRARGAHPHLLCSRHFLFGRVTSLSAPSRRTISCEAVPPSIWPPGAQGGTSACRTGAALSFVSCIALFDSLALLLAFRTHRAASFAFVQDSTPRSVPNGSFLRAVGNS